MRCRPAHRLSGPDRVPVRTEYRFEKNTGWGRASVGEEHRFAEEGGRQQGPLSSAPPLPSGRSVPPGPFASPGRPASPGRSASSGRHSDGALPTATPPSWRCAFRMDEGTRKPRAATASVGNGSAAPWYYTPVTLPFGERSGGRLLWGHCSFGVRYIERSDVTVPFPSRTPMPCPTPRLMAEISTRRTSPFPTCAACARTFWIQEPFPPPAMPTA